MPPDTNKADPVPEGFKRCSRGESCLHPTGCIQPIANFYSDKSRSDGLANKCKACAQVADRVYRVQHPDKYRAYKRRWNSANANKVSESNRIWNNIHPESNRTRKLRREARKRGLADTFTAADWQHALDYFDGCCAYCLQPPATGQALHADHFRPLSKGGATIPRNIVPACQICNSSKGSKHPKQWLEERFSKLYAIIILRRIREYFASLTP